MIRPGEAKLRYDLISYTALELVAKVATMGSEKHGENDWRIGNERPPLTSSQAFGAMLRHIEHVIKGVLTDPESGLPPIAHVIWNAMAIAEIQLLRPELDDIKEKIK